MTMLVGSARLLAIGAAILIAIAVALPAAAEQRNPDGTPNPTASVVDEQTLLHQSPRISGRIDIPERRESILVQPAGRSWDFFHEVILRWFGAVVILGMIALLGVAYLIIGRIRMSAPPSGTRIPRFNGFERFSHWLTAVSFVILGLTGLNITFGRILLLPIMGPDNFSALAQVLKYMHNFVSFSFVIGLVLIAAIWIRDNFPQHVDLEWFKEGGGFIKSKHPPAGRFNAGEKLVFWFALAGGAAVIVSGYLLMFPFYVTNIFGMQIAQAVHAIIAMLFIALILAHIYIGTIGMEGAFEAMGQGTVDLTWAKEHHSVWVAEQLAHGEENKPGSHMAATPAE
jgi:formate dehydrogenase subunit gamma